MTAVIEKPEIATREEQEEIMSRILMTGDISGLTHKQQWEYTKLVCAHVGIDPVTLPFKKIVKKSKEGAIISETLYATKACGDQISRKHDLTVIPADVEILEKLGIAKCRAKASEPEDHTGRIRKREASAYTTIDYFVAANQKQLLRGDDLCNALMRCETKACQRAILGLIGLGMPSETELETIAEITTSPIISSGIVDEQIADHGGVLTEFQRREARSWWRNALSQGDAGFDNERSMAHQCLADLKVVVVAQGAHNYKDAAWLREKAIDEVLEVARLDQSAKTGESYTEAKAIPDQAPPKPEKELTAEQLSKCIKWMQKMREKGIETSATILIIEALAANKYVGSDARANQLLQAWCELPKPQLQALQSELAGDTVASTQEIQNVDVSATQSDTGNDLIAEARKNTPQLSELTGKKKPISKAANEKLEQALQTIHRMRNEISQREGNEGDLVHPSPNWLDTAAPLLRSICDVAKWPKEKAQTIFKSKFRLHANSFNDPAIMTWDLLQKMVIWFASTDPAEIKE